MRQLISNKTQSTRVAAVRDGERGQVLLLFVAIFTVILALSAFAIDQGMWLGKRRIAQKDADTAARAGASKLLFDPGDYAGAESIALYIAERNLVKPNASSSYEGKPDCTDYAGNTLVDVPSLEVRLNEPTRSLFSGAFGITGVNPGAEATACVGSIVQLGPSMKNGIPVAIYSDDVFPNTCFQSTGSPPDVKLGFQCGIKSGAQGNRSRGYFRIPTPDECDGSGGIPKGSPIIDGIDFTCKINPGNSCNAINCIDQFPGTGGSNIPDDFHARLTRTTANNCASAAFSDVFEYADGSPGPVKGPAGLNTPVNTVDANVDAPGTVYVRKPCQSPRFAFIIIGDGLEAPVRGFAAIYIVGCYDERDPMTEVVNDCSGLSSNGHAEVHAIVVSVVLTDGEVGGIGPPNPNSPQAILMFK